MTVARGDTFKTRVTISNPSGKSFNEVRLALHYDRDVLKPVSYSDKGLKSYLAGSSRMEVNPQVGVMVYTAKLAAPFSRVTDGLFDVKWEALELSNRADITVVNYDQEPSGLWMGTADILANEENAGDGFINASVQILPPDLYEEFKRGLRRGRGGNVIEEISLNQMPASVGGVKLSLAGPDHPIQVGDTFQVDIIFDNSADSFVDRVDVYLKYDPEVLDVLDTDEGNWMTRGVNILDGPYHALFPFDYHIENQVFAGRGEIVYRMGITDPERLRHRVGTLATVTFRAKAPVPSTSVAFRMPDRSFAPGTKLRYLEDSVLGDEVAGDDGVKGLGLRIYN